VEVLAVKRLLVLLPFAVVTLCAFVLASCYGAPDFDPNDRPVMTTCGMVLRGGTDAQRAELDRQERITLAALESVTTDVQWTRAVTCPQLAGAEVSVSPLEDGGMWTTDELFFRMTEEYDRGSYREPLAVRVTTDDWSNPEFSWQLVRIITRGEGLPGDVLWVTGDAIATATVRGRDSSVEPIPPLLSGATGN
jgi:hypothetical protein